MDEEIERGVAELGSLLFHNSRRNEYEVEITHCFQFSYVIIIG